VKVGYVDGSAFIRRLALPGERGAQVDLGQFDRLVSSELIQIETARKLDRLGLAGVLSGSDVARLRLEAIDVLSHFELVAIDELVVVRAQHSLGSPLASLDAVHLATLQLWHERNLANQLVLVTHDHELAQAAQKNGYPVLGR
jgi:predicted nucleic acid-binding protein